MSQRLNLIVTHFNSKSYSFHIKTIETIDPSDLQRKFLKQQVILINCENPSEKERQVIEEQTPLYETLNRDITIEKDSYPNLRHSQLLESVRKHPANYLHPQIPIPYEQRLS